MGGGEGGGTCKEAKVGIINSCDKKECMAK